MLEKTLESALDDHFAIVPKDLFEEAQEKAFEELDYEECTEEQCIMKIKEILQVENAFQLVLMEEDGDTQISLTWNDLDQKRVEEEYCEDCKTKKLRDSLVGIVEVLLNDKNQKVYKEKPVVQKIKNHDNSDNFVSVNKNLSSEEKIYLSVIEKSRDAMGCGLFAQDPLEFPKFSDSYNVLSYSRMCLYGDRFWQKSGITINKGEKVFIIGSGKITTCPKTRCINGGPSTPSREKIWIKINDVFDRIQFTIHDDIYLSKFSTNISGELDLVAQDWSGPTPKFMHYIDNSGFYLFDIFTYKKELEKEFIEFLKEEMY